MIILCESQCKGFSHEQVNSGFVYGLKLAYPNEKLVLFADRSHFRNIISIFKRNNISTKDLRNTPITFNAERSFTLGGILHYYFLFKNLFDKALNLGVNKIFFLSNNPVILFIIKLLKMNKKYTDLHFTFVLHGELEDISNESYKEQYAPSAKRMEEVVDVRSLFIKVIHNYRKIPLFIMEKLTLPLNAMNLRYSLFFKSRIRMKKMLLWNHSSQYHYVSLSPHVTKNAKKYINIDYLNFYTIIMPIIFRNSTVRPNNKFVKFAVFGYGDSSQMQKMLLLLSKMNLSKPYEIRIISMDRRGTWGFQNITYVGNNKTLERSEMDDASRDIDIFINLYDKTRHKLGCSLSIFESISYLKPVLHLSNDGYNFFNKTSKPIGFREEDLNLFVKRMADIIENFPSYKKRLDLFRRNMVEFRAKYAIWNNLDRLRESFSF